MQKYIITFILSCSILKAYGCTVIRFSEADYPNASKICKTFVTSNTINVDECLTTKKMSNHFKIYGIAHCLNVNLHQTISLADKEAQNLAPTFGWSVETDTRQDIWRLQRLCAGFLFDIDSPLKELKTYIDNIYKRQSNKLSAENVAQCLKIYDSHEYNAEVERIIKKYCKECK